MKRNSTREPTEVNKMNIITKQYFKAPEGFLIVLFIITFPLWIPVLIANLICGGD